MDSPKVCRLFLINVAIKLTFKEFGKTQDCIQRGSKLMAEFFLIVVASTKFHWPSLAMP